MEVYNGTYCVYVHINKINGKKYVGQTINGNNPNKRWDNGNGYKHSPIFWKAIQKYGWDNFEHDVIASNLTKEEADNFEKLLIKKLDTMNSDNGYNVEPGGSNNRTMSESTRNKLRELRIGKKNPMYGVRLTKEKNGMYGKHHSDETKKKISNAIRGEKHCNYGKKMSAEQKEKISKSKLGKYTGADNPFYGKRHTEETRRKIGDANLGSNSTNAQQVVQMDDNNNVIRIWDCIADVELALNIRQQNIWAAINGVQKHAGGYRWFYLYDRVRKDGITILGAISLGYILRIGDDQGESSCV